MQCVELVDGVVSVRQRDVPIAGSGESLVRVQLAGICSTDLELADGYMNFEGILGHEFVGVVKSSDDSSLVGQRVVCTINIAPAKFAGDPSDEESTKHLPGRSVLGILNRDGVMAEYAALPTPNLIPVPDDVSDRQAVFTEPLAAALRIAEQLPVSPSNSTAVIGPGRLGMLVAKVLSLGGASVTVVGRTGASLKLAREWGLPTRESQVAEDASYDFVVEATGNSSGLETAMRIARPKGTVVMKSTYAAGSSIDLSPIVVNELNVVGSRCGPFGPALRLLQQRAIAVENLIDGEYALADAVEGFAHARRPGVRKILLLPHGTSV